MVDTLFGLLENSKASNFNEALGGKLKTLTGMALGTRDLDADSRRMIAKLGSLFLSLGFGSLVDRYAAKRAEARTENGQEEGREAGPEEEKNG